MLSGIGPAEHLRSHGIAVVLDRASVGQNLQDHLQVRLIYRCSKPITTNDDLRSLSGRLRIGLEWLLRGTGPLATGINQGGLFTRVLPESQNAGHPVSCRDAVRRHGRRQGARFLGLHAIGLSVATREHRRDHAGVVRSVRAAEDQRQLSGGRDRPPLHHGSDRICPQARGNATAEGLRRR